MTTLTEGKHAGEFIISEANNTRSREVATVASGQNLVAGQAVQLSAGKLIAFTGTLNTDGDVITAPVGILFDNVDASSTGANADVTGCVYIARDAEVALDKLTIPTGTDENPAAIDALATLGIICR